MKTFSVLGVDLQLDVKIALKVRICAEKSMFLIEYKNHVLNDEGLILRKRKIHLLFDLMCLNNLFRI